MQAELNHMVEVTNGTAAQCAPGPLFVVGVPRSGTTLLCLMLDAHSRIAIPYESHFFVKYYQEPNLIPDLGSKAGRACLVEMILQERYVKNWDCVPTLADVDLDQCQNLADTISQVFGAYARLRGKDIWGDKTPRYVTHIDILNDLFPTSKIIHIIRDGRDVASSLVTQGWHPGLIHALREWRERIKIGRAQLSQLPANRYYELRFEDLVASPEPHLRQICSQFGLEFEPGMVDSYRETASKKLGQQINGKHQNLTRSVSSDQTYKWKKVLGPADQAVAFDVAGDLLTELGYPSGCKTHILKPFRKFYHRIAGGLKWRLAAMRRRT